MDEPTQSERVCLGVIAAPHGVKGLVRVRSYTEDPAAISDYGDLSNAAGDRVYRLTVQGNGPKGTLLCRIDGIADRTAAAALRGQELYVARDRLPDTGDAETFYHADLIGLAVETPGGEAVGRVAAVHNFGAGDVLEIERGDGSELIVPFTRAVVPTVDLGRRRIVAAVPDEEAAEPEGGG